MKVVANISNDIRKFYGRTGYQIFVDRFYREEGNPIPEIPGRVVKKWDDAMPNWRADEKGEFKNDYFYGGNLKGIIAKLDYIKEMGFDLVYLTPITISKEYHHYDVEDHCMIDPYIGDWDDLEKLCLEARKRDMLIMVDLVFNHVGVGSKYFQDAMNNKGSPYREWFEFKDGEPVYWWGYKNLPQCNKQSEAYIKYCCQVVRNYISKGVSAIRFDLGENLPKEFLDRLREEAKKEDPSILLANERWGEATNNSCQIEYVDYADTVMNYLRLDGLARWVVYGNNAHFRYTEERIILYPNEVKNVSLNFLDTHDTPRAINMYSGIGMNQDPFSGYIGDIEKPWRYNDSFDTMGFRQWEEENDVPKNMDIAKKRLKLASSIQYLMQGIPFTLYGTEAGITGYKDPFNRKPYPWGKQDKELLEHYQKIGKLRKENRDILAEGWISERIMGDVLMILREKECGRVIGLFNRSQECKDLRHLGYAGLNPENTILRINGSTEEKLEPYGGIIIRI